MKEFEYRNVMVHSHSGQVEQCHVDSRGVQALDGKVRTSGL